MMDVWAISIRGGRARDICGTLRGSTLRIVEKPVVAIVLGMREWEIKASDSMGSAALIQQLQEERGGYRDVAGTGGCQSKA